MGIVRKFGQKSRDSHKLNARLLISVSVIGLAILCFIAADCFQKPQVEKKNRSTSLQRVVSQSDEFIRVDYLNELGELTLADDLHYATMIETKGDHTTLTEYYDAAGNPIEQEAGYYAVLSSYNELGQKVKITYLNKHHNPTVISTGYSIAKQFYNDNNQLERVLLYDIHEEAIQTSPFGYGYELEYNEAGKRSKVIFLDSNGEPLITSQGFAIQVFEYYRVGNTNCEYLFYCDEEEQPIALSQGQFGIRREYDEYGRTSKITYLDANRQALSIIKGYAIIEYTWYDDDTIRTELYFDQNGNPVKLAEGQYGVLYSDGKTDYLDKNGKRIYNVRNSLYNNTTIILLICLLFAFAAIFEKKSFTVALLVLSLSVIFYMTLMFRNGAGSRYTITIFGSYSHLFFFFFFFMTIMRNICLFVPLGIILYRIYPQKTILLLPLALSIVIEMVQFFTGYGYCEIDDIISNSVGGVLGYMLESLLWKLFHHSKSYN